MNWNLFWSAFGAIGTTIGSLITGIAVIIAVKQYRQPLKKAINMGFTSAVSMDEISGKPLYFYCITLKNRGLRTLQINSFHVKGDRKSLWINNIQFDSNAKVRLPFRLDPETSVDFLIEGDVFRNALREAVANNELKKNQRLILFATDSLGDRYYCKPFLWVRQLIKG